MRHIYKQKVYKILTLKKYIVVELTVEQKNGTIGQLFVSESMIV